MLQKQQPVAKIASPEVSVKRFPRPVLHLFKFFAAREDFIALVERASKPATPTFLSALRAAHPFWLRLRCFVGRPILAAAGFSRLARPAIHALILQSFCRRPPAGCCR